MILNAAVCNGIGSAVAFINDNGIPKDALFDIKNDTSGEWVVFWWSSGDLGVKAPDEQAPPVEMHPLDAVVDVPVDAAPVEPIKEG